MASIPSQTLPAAQPHRAGKLKKISLIPFVAILYAYCAGGPFDYEANEQLSTVIEEVEKPTRNFPRGLAIVVPWRR